MTEEVKFWCLVNFMAKMTLATFRAKLHKPIHDFR